jgi:hypothetical protein
MEERRRVGLSAPPVCLDPVETVPGVPGTGARYQVRQRLASGVRSVCGDAEQVSIRCLRGDVVVVSVERDDVARRPYRTGTVGGRHDRPSDDRVFGHLHRRFRFECEGRLRPHSAVDGPAGLRLGWSGVVWSAPDADTAEDHVRQAVASASRDSVVVMRLPAAWTSDWWFDLVMPNAAEVWCTRPRAGLPTDAVVIFAPVEERVGAEPVLRRWDPVTEPPPETPLSVLCAALRRRSEEGAMESRLVETLRTEDRRRLQVDTAFGRAFEHHRDTVGPDVFAEWVGGSLARSLSDVETLIKGAELVDEVRWPSDLWIDPVAIRDLTRLSRRRRLEVAEWLGFLGRPASRAWVRSFCRKEPSPEPPVRPDPPKPDVGTASTEMLVAAAQRDVEDLRAGLAAAASGGLLGWTRFSKELVRQVRNTLGAARLLMRTGLLEEALWAARIEALEALALAVETLPCPLRFMGLVRRKDVCDAGSRL